MIMRNADSPVTGFEPFFNPATGEWITYTALARTATDSSSASPGAASPAA
jgi:hypothetical protein